MSHSPTEFLPAIRGVHGRFATLGRARFGRVVLSGLLAATTVVGGVGCGVSKPNLAHPGDIQSQRFNAVAHDPYTDTDAGPEVVGGRPRDFQKNLAEPVRNRWLMDSWWSRR